MKSCTSIVSSVPFKISSAMLVEPPIGSCEAVREGKCESCSWESGVLAGATCERENDEIGRGRKKDRSEGFVACDTRREFLLGS